MLGCKNEQLARNLFDKIRKKIQFPTEVEQGIVPFEFLGIVKDYNGADNITQTPDYVEMSCKNHITRLLKSHGWDTTSKLKSESKDNIASKYNVPVHTKNKLICAWSETHDLNCTQLETCTFLETSPKDGNYCKPLVPDTSDQKNDSNNFLQDSSINSQLSVAADSSMEPSYKISSLPSDCIDQLYKDKGPMEGSNGHLLLEKLSGFLYCTLLGELMYSFITCWPDIGYAVTKLSKFILLCTICIPLQNVKKCCKIFAEHYWLGYLLSLSHETRPPWF